MPFSIDTRAVSPSAQAERTGSGLARRATMNMAVAKVSVYMGADGRAQHGVVEADMPKMYEELAPWWPLLSAPADYEEEADFYGKTLAAACTHPPRSVLELGSGGGNNASHMKAQYELVLVEPAVGMLAVSRFLNPECEHVQGDMRTVRLATTCGRAIPDVSP